MIGHHQEETVAGEAGRLADRQPVLFFPLVVSNGRDGEAVRGGLGGQVPLDRLARVARHHDELANAGSTRGVDSPVDQGLSGDLEQRLAGRAASQAAPPPGGDDDAGRRRGHSTHFLAQRGFDRLSAENTKRPPGLSALATFRMTNSRLNPRPQKAGERGLILTGMALIIEEAR